MIGTVGVIESQFRNVIEISNWEMRDHMSWVTLDFFETWFFSACCEIDQEHTWI